MYRGQCRSACVPSSAKTGPQEPAPFSPRHDGPCVLLHRAMSSQERQVQTTGDERRAPAEGPDPGGAMSLGPGVPIRGIRMKFAVLTGLLEVGEVTTRDLVDTVFNLVSQERKSALIGRLAIHSLALHITSTLHCPVLSWGVCPLAILPYGCLLCPIRGCL